MPALSNEQLPILAGALLRLRGFTLATVFNATSIRVANLSAWLKGKPQVISAGRVTALMYHLGVQGGQVILPEGGGSVHGGYLAGNGSMLGAGLVCYKIHFQPV